MEPAVTEARFLVVDDESDIRNLLTLSLQFVRYEMFGAGDDIEALCLTITEKPNLMIPDVMLPDMDGFAVTRGLRATEIDMPILLLAAKDNMRDKVERLQAGRDDHVTKSFGLEEVVAHINAILRRTKHGSSEQPLLWVADLELDDNLYKVHRNEKLIDLSPTEFKLLRCLMVNEGRVVSKSQILGHVQEYDWEGDAAIMESYISYLQRKLDAPDKRGNIPPLLIQARRGVGYLLCDFSEQNHPQSPTVTKIF